MLRPFAWVKQTRRLWVFAGTAVVVGVIVAVVARAIGESSCPVEEAFVRTTCRDLVTDLSARVGGFAAFAVVFMEVLSAGLTSTWSAMEADRSEADERDAPLSSR